MSISIMRKPIKIEIDNKEYDFVLDFESALKFQDMYEKSIFVGIDNIRLTQDLRALAYLVASCVKDPATNKCVGLEFVNKLDLLAGLNFFMDKIAELMENSLPEETDEDKKKSSEVKEI